MLQMGQCRLAKSLKRQGYLGLVVQRIKHPASEAHSARCSERMRGDYKDQ